MTEALAILAALAFGIILILLTPWLAVVLGNALNPRELVPNFCDRLCKIRIFVGWLLGLLTGLFLCLCWIYLRTLLAFDPLCLSLIFLLLLLSFLVALKFAKTLLACGFAWHGESFGSVWFRLWLILLFLAVIVLAALLYFTRFQLGDIFANTICGWILLAAILVAVIFVILCGWEYRYCRKTDSGRECQAGVRRWALILIFLQILTLWQIWLCRDHLGELDAGLAMVGIYWEGKYDNEEGAHLRWSFETGLGFPSGGFDIYRRPSGSGLSGWTRLNAERIHPVRTWDGAGPTDEWTSRGEDRLPALLHPRFEGANAENIDFLIELSQLPPNDLLYYVAGIDAPFATEAQAQAASDAAAAADPDGTIPLQWETEPMSLLMTMALHPEIARLLGLYWIDQTGDPVVEYDYRVVGYWGNVLRSWRVDRLSGANTLALDPPVLTEVSSVPSPVRTLPDGSYWPTEAHVTLNWEPVTQSPEIDLTQADGIRPVFHRPERQDLGPVDGAPLPAPDPFARLTVPSVDAGADFVEADPVLVLPEEVEGQPDRWPDVFGYDGYVDYRHYAYRIVGIDLFGRESPTSNELEVDVIDAVAPPAPPNQEAAIWQWADPLVARLAQADADAMFPTNPLVNNGEPENDMALRVSWIWPDEMIARVQDLKEFRLLWREDSGDPWEGPIGPAVTPADALPMPPRHAGIGGDYHEVTLNDLPQAFLDAFAADDDEPVRYGQIAVVAVDHDSFNNTSPTTGQVVVFARDLIPPHPPQAPVLVAEAGAPDRSGNAALGLEIGAADGRYTYRLYRLDDRDVAGVPDSAPLPPGCLADSDPDLAVLQARAADNPSLFRGVTPVAVPPAGAVVEMGDTVDVSQPNGRRYYYAATAIDPAGNESLLSCPSLSVLVPDRVAPRAPVPTAIVGADGGVEITWNRNREPDIDRYEIYRTAEKDRLTSRRKMTLVLAAAPNGTTLAETPDASDAVSVPVTGAPETRLLWRDGDAVPGRVQYYRMAAVDTSGNRSDLSERMSGQAIDLTAPAAPGWDDPAALPEVISQVMGTVQLTWLPVDDPSGVSYLVQRQVSGSPLWLGISGWIEGNAAPQFVDSDVPPGQSYSYRVRAMDGAGNRSDWSDVIAVDVPMP